MYIITTTQKDTIAVDADELSKIALAAPDDLIFLRNGAVLRRMIATITQDKSKAESFLKLAGESEDTRKKRIESSTSEDIFQGLREEMSGQPKQLLP